MGSTSTGSGCRIADSGLGLEYWIEVLGFEL